MEESKEMESFSVFGYGSGGSVKKKRRRRVSFATTQTVHFIPRKEDIETPPLGSGDVSQKPTPPHSHSSSAFSPLNDKVMVSSAPFPDLASDLNEHTEDFGNFTCDMDTGHGSWIDEDTATRRNSLDGDEGDSGCFVNIGFSDQGDDDSIVNDDITMDATTFTKNLSQVLKSGTTFDSGFWSKISPQKDCNESASESVDDSMALTRQGSLHRNMVHNEVSFDADDIESDMSIGTRVHSFKWRREIISLQNKVGSDETGSLSLGEASRGTEVSQPLHREASHKRSVELEHNKAQDERAISSCYKQEEKLEDEVTSAPYIEQSNWDADFSMQLGNTMDISLHRPVLKVADSLMQLDGNSHGDSDFSMPLNNTMDMSLHQSIAKGSDALDRNSNCDSEDSVSINNTMDISLHPRGSGVSMCLDGSSHISSISRQRSGDLTFSATTFNNTVPAHNLKDLLSDYTDYTITKTNMRGRSEPNDDSISLIIGGSRLLASSNERHGSPSPDFVEQHSLTGIDIETKTKARANSEVSLNKNEVSTPTNLTSTYQGVLTEFSSKGPDQTKLRDPGERLLKHTNLHENLSSLKVDGKTDLPGEVTKVDSRKITENVLIDITNKEPMQSKSTDRIQKIFRDPKQEQIQSQLKVNSKSDACGDILKPSSDKRTESVRKIGTLSILSRSSHSKGSITIDGILQRLEDNCSIGEFLDKEEAISLPLTSNLLSLSDYLHFSCSMHLQLELLNDHVEELTEKLKSLKETNSKLRVSNNIIQKLKEDSSSILKSKFEKKKRLARKEWILWKISPERQNLAWLQDNKDNLFREVDAAQGKIHQVLQLKESYSQALSNMRSSRLNLVQGSAVSSTAIKKRQEEERGVSQVAMLEKCNRHYEDAYERLKIAQGNKERIHRKIVGMISVYNDKFSQGVADINGALVAKNMKQSIQVAALFSSFLQHQQVMRVCLTSNEGKSQTQFSIERMYLQIFQYEGDGPLALANIRRSLNREAIDMAFPCMDAFVAFEYLVSDLHNVITIQVQHMHQLMQRTKWMFGCLMDLLKEIKYCQRTFGISCKFQMKDDKLVLTQAMLRCAAELKISLVFDMTFIRGGKYPSDMRPAEVFIHSYGSANNSITRRDVNVEVAKLEPGFGRFFRICSSIEKLMSR